MYAAANRDQRAFDDPDLLDVRRSSQNRHVAFGFGTHFCLGAHLARLEIRVMFEELLRRIPDWELVDPDEPQIMPATFARAYDRIRIRFTAEPLMATTTSSSGWRTWFAAQLPDADDVRVEGLDRVEVGHSAETLLVTVVDRVASAAGRRDTGPSGTARAARALRPAAAVHDPACARTDAGPVAAGVVVRAQRARCSAASST